MYRRPVSVVSHAVGLLGDSGVSDKSARRILQLRVRQLTGRNGSGARRESEATTKIGAIFGLISASSYV